MFIIWEKQKESHEAISGECGVSWLYGQMGRACQYIIVVNSHAPGSIFFVISSELHHGDSFVHLHKNDLQFGIFMVPSTF